MRTDLDTSVPCISGFHVHRRIGSGATAQVYEATREADAKKVALKVVSLLSLEDDSIRERLRREAQTLQSLRHPNIVRLYNFWESQENLILELELVEGGTLTDWMRRNPAGLLEPRLWILSQLAQALAVAHLDGTIHRDLKPDNVLISDRGEVKLTDFGLAKRSSPMSGSLTLPGVVIGSLSYMAPEALNEGNCSYASDIFAFGAITYELLTGKHPFPHPDIKTLLENLYHASRETMRPMLLPERLETSLLSCMSADPVSRPTALWGIHAELMAYLEQTQMLPYCTALAGADAPEGLLAEALSFKSKRLKQSIEEEANQPQPDRKRLIRQMNEFSKLFPDDPQTRAFPALLKQRVVQQAEVRKPRNAALAILFLLICMVSIGAHDFFQWRAQRLHPVSTETITLSQAALTPAVPAAPVPNVPVTLHKVAKAAKPVPPTQQSTTGLLEMDVPDDVRVFVDGRRLGRTELKGGLPFESGRHQILMEREGYFPIEKTIFIKSGDVTKIRVGGEEG